jgi:rhamnosyltransferase
MTLENSGVVIVTYFPDDGFLYRLSLIAKQFKNIVIVDNSGLEEEREIPAVLTKYNVKVIINKRNLGVATALNQGIKFLSDINCSWITCFDQDSEIKENFIAEVRKITESYSSRHVIVGGNYERSILHKLSHFSFKGDEGYKECKTVITSGSTFTLNLWRELGGFNEGYFIDSVDHEFCLRAKAISCQVIITKAIVMSHSIGHEGRLTLVPLHSPLRKYYISRNVVHTIRLCFMRENFWCLKQVLRLFVEFISILLIESQKIDKIKFYFIGLFHGFKNKYGSYEG